MNNKQKAFSVIITVLAVLLAAYILFPFYLVLMNSAKTANAIVASPVSTAGVSISQLMENLTNVINNSNFSFWSAFGTSLVITIVSLIALALFNLDGLF